MQDEVMRICSDVGLNKKFEECTDGIPIRRKTYRLLTRLLRMRGSGAELFCVPAGAVGDAAARGRGGRGRAGKLYSWNGKLLQAVREEGEVVRLLDLQSSGTVLWERGQSVRALGAQILKRILINDFV